jgi:hypothetical protein
MVPEARKCKRSDYRRWERSRAMELWQMDIVGGVRLADGSEAKIVSGIDDHSRFVVSAAVVARATARPATSSSCGWSLIARGSGRLCGVDEVEPGGVAQRRDGVVTEGTGDRCLRVGEVDDRDVGVDAADAAR